MFLGIFYLVGVNCISIYNGYGKNIVSARTFPFILGIIMIILSVLQMITSIHLQDKRDFDNTDPKYKKNKTTKKTNFFMVIILILYPLILPILGFILGTFLFLFFQIFLLTKKEKRIIWKIVLLSIITPVILYTIFVYGFSLILPQGILG
jgi:putative tricarboxylic transport membrane protein